MSLVFHWFLPTSGDGRGIVGRGHSIPLVGSTAASDHATGARAATRPPDIDYLGQIARSAEQLGFTGVLTPTGTWCEDAWLTTAALISQTKRLKFLVAFRPGFVVPTLAAQMAATYQRLSGGRLLLNVVTGGEEAEQRRFGDHLSHDERYARTGEFLDIVRGAWTGTPYDFAGNHYRVEGATVMSAPDPVPTVYFGQRNMRGLHEAYRDGGTASDLEIYPNLWAGVGLVRGGAGTALVGSHADVAERIEEYASLGIEEFIMSGYPHLEEAYWFGEGVLPELRRRGTAAAPADLSDLMATA
jgi:alkanesulfonate monooxygenase SsuD/methylene tetrahydromethanopterin reductase-like flavin-dependent oxidoreductase (luciferase family)